MARLVTADEAAAAAAKDAAKDAADRAARDGVAPVTSEDAPPAARQRT